MTYTSKLTVRGGYERNFMTRDYFNLPIVNFPFICRTHILKIEKLKETIKINANIKD